MIKITQGHAHLIINSPVAGKLFNDDKKQFPLKSALIIADFIEQIKSRQQAYIDTVKKIVKKYNGITSHDGSIAYDDPLNRDRAGKEISEINQVEIELNGEQLTIDDDWPKLTLAEASLLKPFIKG